MNSSFITLNEHLGRFNDILNTISILIWDSRTKMPKEGAQTRGMQIGTQTLIARDLLLSSKLRKLLEESKNEIESKPKTVLKKKPLFSLKKQ